MARQCLLEKTFKSKNMIWKKSGNFIYCHDPVKVDSPPLSLQQQETEQQGPPHKNLLDGSKL